jgi:DNA invertase Pin-like site-specific DNA recombinase
MLYGYVRISKPKQSIERQIRNIKSKYSEAVIVDEAFTGTTTSRPKWQKLYAAVKEGDSIVFDSVSRMSRNAEEGFADYEKLYQRGVDLIFLKEPLINTATFKSALASSVPLTGTNVDYILDGVNRFLMELAREQIRLAFEQAEKEVSDLHQRTREGIETARLNGKQIGHPTGVKITTKKSIQAKEQIRKYSREYDGTLNDTDVIRLLGISRNTFYKYKREMNNK